MEADWSVEVGSGLPRIDASWEGFVDLRKSPEKLDSIEEARSHSAIREALSLLNGADSPVFTTKCDTWTLTHEEIDPDEFAASGETARAGFASYIDMVGRNPARFASFEFHERRVRELTTLLRALDVQQGRVDMVVRAAHLQEQDGYGITLYAAGCGADEASAQTAWRAVLASAVAATIAGAARPPHAGE